MAKNVTALMDRGLRATGKKLKERALLQRALKDVNEAAGAIDGASLYAGLHKNAMAVLAMKRDDTSSRLNVLVPRLEPGKVFAGLRTALDVAAAAAVFMRLPLRVLCIDQVLTETEKQTLVASVRQLAGKSDLTIEIVGANELPLVSQGRDDIWLATYWTTAFALSVAAKCDVIRAEQVVYLIQDYEPGFFAWSTESALAESTYDSGFIPMVNSRPLAAYVGRARDLRIDAEHIFFPRIDLQLLQRAAESRVRSDASRILFYGRPSKPRNGFDIGVAALRIARRTLASEGIDIAVVSAGEAHPNIALDDGREITSLGTLPWDDYFSTLGRTDVVFSLQLSPHPSHPPLDAVASGAYAVINDVAGTRSGIHERLLAGPASPDALAAILCDAVRRSRVSPPASFEADFLAKLGNSLEQTVEVVFSRYRRP